MHQFRSGRRARLQGPSTQLGEPQHFRDGEAQVCEQTNGGAVLRGAPPVTFSCTEPPTLLQESDLLKPSNKSHGQRPFSLFIQ